MRNGSEEPVGDGRSGGGRLNCAVRVPVDERARRWRWLLVTVIATAACGPAEAPPETSPGTSPAQYATPPRTTDVQVYFSRGEEPEPVTREVAADSPLRGALQALVRGPTAEERQAGLDSWFSAETADMVRGVSIDDGGRAVVDFEDLSALIPNASTAAGSAMLLGSLNRTVFQFPNVAEVEYRMAGSCDAFWEWLQRACAVLRRDEAGV